MVGGSANVYSPPACGPLSAIDTASTTDAGR